MTISDSQLASQCQGIAHRLSYDDPNDGEIKRALEEAAHRLDSASVRVHPKRDGLLLINARGKSRFMTLRERVAYWLLDNKLEIRP